jgi:cysteine desulfurase
MPIYLDNSATTQVRQEVVDAMLPFLHDNWGNPSSIHSAGRKAKEAIGKARRQVADLLSCDENEVYFSPCGTLSNNVAMIGRARFAEANGMGRHLITTSIEHPSVLGPAKHLEAIGWQVTYLPVDSEGLVRVKDFEAAITKETSIISIMWANNEIGTVEPIEELAAIADERGIFFHTDAVQMPGKLPLNMAQVPVCSLALSGHKFHAPKGIGILYVRKLKNVMPVIYGGGQEMGLMPGTEGVANIVAIGVAAELAHKNLAAARRRLTEMQKVIIEKVCTVDGVRITGARDMAKRLPGHVSVACPGVEGEALVMRSDLRGICVSSGSACHQGIIEPSQVLKAIGLCDREAIGSLRITAGTFNTLEECHQAADTLATIFQTLVKQTGSQPAQPV